MAFKKDSITDREKFMILYQKNLKYKVWNRFTFSFGMKKGLRIYAKVN